MSTLGHVDSEVVEGGREIGSLPRRSEFVPCLRPIVRHDRTWYKKALNSGKCST